MVARRLDARGSAWLYTARDARGTLARRFRIMAFRAPLLGYNTNVRHKGKLYHIQTEDSGVDHPHVITHLFADGGRVVASRKTSYAERVGSEGLAESVKKLMQAQHKAMFIALRDGVYDDDSMIEGDQTGPQLIPNSSLIPKAEPAPPPEPVPVSPPIAAPRAAEPVALPEPPLPRKSPRPPPPPMSVPPPAPSAIARAQARPASLPPRAAEPPAAGKAKEAARSLFGGDGLIDKSLDEVILNYLAAHDKDV